MMWQKYPRLFPLFIYIFMFFAEPFFSPLQQRVVVGGNPLYKYITYFLQPFGFDRIRSFGILTK